MRKLLALLTAFCFLSSPVYCAIDFDGTDDAITFGVDDAVMRENQAVTISAWVYPRSTGGGGLGSIVTRNGVGDVRLKLDNLGGGSVAAGFLIVGVTVLNRVTVNGSVVLNRWQHILVTHDGSTTASNCHIYINGVEPAYITTTNGVTPTDNSTGAIRIGSTSTTTRVFDGLISEVAVWDSVLPFNDIRKLSAPVRRTPMQITPQPKRYYPLDDFGSGYLNTVSGAIKNRIVGVNDNGTQSGGAVGVGDMIAYP